MTGVDQRARTPLDLTPLDRKPDRAAVRAYRREVRSAMPVAVVGLRQRAASVVGVVAAALMISCVVFLYRELVIGVVSFAFETDTTDVDADSRVAAVILLIVCGGIAAALIRLLLHLAKRDFRVRNRWRRRTRLDEFATRNGGVYVPEGDVPGFQGSIIPWEADAHVRDVVEFPTFDAVGSVRVTTLAHGIRWVGDDWGFLRVRLDRPVPHMVLVSVASRRRHGRRRSRVPLAESQRLSLEGDFDRHFTLYAPDGYGPDALYVFTPDLMALLIDELPECDVDLVDDSIVISTPRPFDLADPVVAERLAALADRIGAAAIRRTARYSDERPGAVPREYVASRGRRLRTRMSTARIVFLSVFGLVVLRWLLMDVLHLF